MASSVAPTSSFLIHREMRISKRTGLMAVCILAIMFLILFGFNIFQLVSKRVLWAYFPDDSNTDALVMHHTYPFSKSYVLTHAEEVNIGCLNCPSWLPEFLRLSHLVAYQNVTELSENNITNVECTGRVEIFPDIGLIKIAYKEIFIPNRQRSNPIKYHGFVDGNVRKSKAGLFGQKDGGQERISDKVAENWKDFLSRFYLAFREILFVESVSVLGGVRLGHSDYGEMTIELNQNASMTEVEANFFKMEQEVKEL